MQAQNFNCSTGRGQGTSTLTMTCVMVMQHIKPSPSIPGGFVSSHTNIPFLFSITNSTTMCRVPTRIQRKVA
jgi:hypothetical protein